MFGSTQIEMFLDTSKEYFIIPSLKNRKQSGIYFFTIYSEEEFSLQTSNISTKLENQPTTKCYVGNKQIHLTNQQYYEKVEEVRERIQMEAKKLKLTSMDLMRIFPENSSSLESKISRTDFKRKLIQLGFSLAEFPDEDFLVLDQDNNGFISRDEFMEFFQVEYQLDVPDQKIEPPPDDLLFQAVDLAGQLSVKVNIAKGLRKASTWFTPTTSQDIIAAAPASTSTSALGGTVEGAGGGPKTRPKFHYSLEDAIKSRSVPPQIISYPPSRSSFRSKKLITHQTPAAAAVTAAAAAPGVTPHPSDSKSATIPGDLQIDTSLTMSLGEMEQYQSPKTYFSIRKNQKPMTTSRSTPLKLLHSLDDTSSLPQSKIHTDQLLVKTEVNRSQALFKWREKFKQQQQQQPQQHGSSDSMKELSRSSILINPHCFKKKSSGGGGDSYPSYVVYKFLGVTLEQYQQMFPEVADVIDLRGGPSVELMIQKYEFPFFPFHSFFSRLTHLSLSPFSPSPLFLL
jgi:hypothetical protein